MAKSDHPLDYLRTYSKYMGMVFQTIVLILLGGFGGKALDERFRPGSNLFTVVFVLLTTFLSFYLFIRQIISKK